MYAYTIGNKVTKSLKILQNLDAGEQRWPSEVDLKCFGHRHFLALKEIHYINGYFGVHKFG